MQARFLLGPAGSGKTFRCLAEIRAELLARPEGPPLILLAPKQATFQLERQLLSDHALPGYTRLQILSFERLADFILRQLNIPSRELLSEEGRVMVLRALLARHQGDLRIFRASASLTGFARQLSQDLRELQRHQLSPSKLRELISNSELSLALRNKLYDLGILFEAYAAWLAQHRLQDSDCLLDQAVEALRHAQLASLPALLLWLDGFAEMTPQELDLLAAVIPYCEKATLAFCERVAPQELSAQSQQSPLRWLSIWSGVNQTRQKCAARLAGLPGGVTVDTLPAHHATRFSENPVLRHLEENWTHPTPFAGSVEGTLRLAVCAGPRQEAVLAAHEILRFVRTGGRYREAAILLRQMEGYHDDLRRVLTRYGIPIFLDRRVDVGCGA